MIIKYTLTVVVVVVVVAAVVVVGEMVELEVVIVLVVVTPKHSDPVRLTLSIAMSISLPAAKPEQSQVKSKVLSEQGASKSKPPNSPQAGCAMPEYPISCGSPTPLRVNDR